MTTITPEEIAGRIAAAAAKRPVHERINNSLRLEQSGLRVVHFLPEACDHPEETRRVRAEGLTVAYRPSVRSPRVLEISTAVCRKGDVFSRKVGTKLAVENFAAGRTVFVPAMPDVGPVGTVIDMFAEGY